ncbi:MAG: sialate O-acetylesterase [Cyclobacteriaceae bacterium]
MTSKELKFIPIVLLFAILSFCEVSAKVKLPAIVSSHMVLQRNTTVVLWGWADANEKIIIKASWLKKPLSLKADNSGNWRVEVKTNDSKVPQTITIKDQSSKIVLEDILFGEVWLCSGQSNMFQPVKGYSQGQPTSNAMMASVKAKFANVRLFSVDREKAKEPLSDLKGYKAWEKANANNVMDFSAVGWFFGQQLQEILDVPVGIIHSSYGGTPVRAWMSKESVSPFENVDLSDLKLEKIAAGKPTILYNAMIQPLIPYTIKGVLWYQGEANRRQPGKYKKYLSAMVSDWRARWGIGDFPFYFVQIAPFDYKPGKFKAVNTAFMREAMAECVDLIPNSGIAITMDIGDEKRIHPPFKKEVADRLLLLALEQTYGFDHVDGKSPKYESMQVVNDTIKLSFKHAETGLFAYDKLLGFEIAGEDQVFYPAEAMIENGNSVVVYSEEVKQPVAVRYAWRNWVKGTLFDNNLLPASSFRTDDWESSE